MAFATDRPSFLELADAIAADVLLVVAIGASEALRRQRRSAFHAEFIAPLFGEAQRLGLTPADIVALIPKDPS